jgi:hypothetical protein
VRNGTIVVRQSRGAGSQAIWHSAISIGAAYGEGGTPDRPSYFSAISGWRVEDLTLAQLHPKAVIAVMSDAHRGVIDRVATASSAKATIGIALDWGAVGPLVSADRQAAKMRQLWSQGKAYSTHPHAILIRNTRVGQLTNVVNDDSAALRCSACYDISIRDMRIDRAGVGVRLVAGDLGFEFARHHERGLAHRGYVIEGISIHAYPHRSGADREIGAASEG